MMKLIIGNNYFKLYYYMLITDNKLKLYSLYWWKSYQILYYIFKSLDRKTFDINYKFKLIKLLYNLYIRIVVVYLTLSNLYKELRPDIIPNYRKFLIDLTSSYITVSRTFQFRLLLKCYRSIYTLNKDLWFLKIKGIRVSLRIHL